MTTAAGCPVCGGQMPDRDRSRGGRLARYCCAACKAKAYRTRQHAGDPAAPDSPPLPEGDPHARAVEIRQQASDLIAILADTASGQQTLFTTPGTARRSRPAEAGRTLHRLITDLTALAATTTAPKRATKRRPPAGMPQAPLFDEPDPDGT